LFLCLRKNYSEMKRNGQGQIKTCRRKQHVKTDGMKGISNLFCGIFAVGGNYNLTRDTLKNYNVDISVDQLSLAFERLMMYIDKGKSISSGDNYSILEVYKEIMKQKDFIVKNYEGCEKSSYHGKKVLKITSEAFQKILKEYGYKVISFMKGLAKHEAIEDKKYYYATGNRYALTEKNNTRRYCLVIPEENTTTLDNNCAA
ncbi:hypothetical protein ACTQ3S_14760, partial [Roseburia faecis]|uniref:hypothetical protein n=1 Tax=Roseburia faecis TaxID=301302 RepID=UPI003F977D02